MNKINIPLKVSVFVLCAVDCLFVLYSIVSLILCLAKKIVLGNVFNILLLIVLIINLVSIVTFIVLYYAKRRK